MRRLLLTGMMLVAGLVGLLGLAATAQAHGWDLSVDDPVLFTFDRPGPAKGGTGPNATWTDTSTTTVSGSKVMLTTPLHIGFGYEDYSVGQRFNVPSSCSSNCTGHATEEIQMADVMIHLPLAGLNVGLGYGQGQANFNVIAPGNPSGSVITAHHAYAQQTFLVVGVPLGSHWDVHLGYHWVSVEQKPLTNSSGGGQMQGSGEMLSAGLQYSWGK